MSVFCAKKVKVSKKNITFAHNFNSQSYQTFKKWDNLF